MTLREALGNDVQRVYEQVDALLDREDGVLALFDGGRVVTYANGFGVSASQLELLGDAIERALHSAVGRTRPARPRGRRNREQSQGSRDRDGVGRNDHGAARRLLQLASWSA